MLSKLFGKKESLQELIIKKPFNEKVVDKKLSKYEIDDKNPSLLHLCAKHNCSDAISYLVKKKNMNVNLLNDAGENALFIAMKNKSVDAIKILLVNKIDFRHADAKGITAFHLSAQYAVTKIFTLMLNNLKTKDVKDKRGRNVLFYAVKSKNKTIVKMVLDLTNIDINCKDNENNTISHLSEISTNKDFFKFLLEQGLDLDMLNDKKEDFLSSNCVNLDLNEELINLALKSRKDDKKYELRDSKIISNILERMLSLDIQILENKTMFARYQERFETFIDYGIDINSLNKEKENILFDLVKTNNTSILEYILEKTKININQNNIHGQNLLDLSLFTMKPNIDVVKTLIYSNIDCTMKDKDGLTVIEKLLDIILSENLPTRQRRFEDVKSFENINYNQILILILDYTKVDIDKLTFEKEPLIFEAAKSFNVPLLEMFKKYGADLNITSSIDNLNVYYKVLESGKDAGDDKLIFLKTLGYLILSNVDIDHKDSYGGTVVHKAILEHELSVINVLTKKTGSFKNRDKKGRTFIHNTVWNDKIDILKKIAFKDKELINKPDVFGFLPINYAVIMGKKDTVFTLIKLGAFLNNPNKINEQYKEQFFSKLGKLGDILNCQMSDSEKNIMTKLVASMQKELGIA